MTPERNLGQNGEVDLASLVGMKTFAKGITGLISSPDWPNLSPEEQTTEVRGVILTSIESYEKAGTFKRNIVILKEVDAAIESGELASEDVVEAGRSQEKPAEPPKKRGILTFFRRKR